MGAEINAFLSVLNVNLHSLEKWNGNSSLEVRIRASNLAKFLDKSSIEPCISEKR